MGSFENENILVIYNDGSYEITDTELTQRFDIDKILLIEQFDPEKVISAVYLDNEKQQFNVKRFKIETTSMHNKFSFIKDGEGNYLETVTTDEAPILHVQTGRGSNIKSVKFKIANLVEIMGWKAIGTKLMTYSKAIEMEWMQKPKDDQPTLFD